MAALATKTMGELNEGKALHPFFQKAPSIFAWTRTICLVLIVIVEPKELQPACEDVQNPSNNSSDQSHSDNAKKVSARAPRKPRTPDTMTQSTAVSSVTTSGNLTAEEDHAELIEVDPNNGRRKRRKTASPDDKVLAESVEDKPVKGVQLKGWLQRPSETSRTGTTSLTAQTPTADIESPELPADADDNVKGGGQALEDPKERGRRRSTPCVILPATSAGLEINTSNKSDTTSQSSSSNREIGMSNPIETRTQDISTKPKKLLRLNPKTGTIGSPPAKNPAPSNETNPKKPPKTRGKQIKSKLVTIRYNPSLGLKIDQILNSSKATMPIPEKTIPEPPKVDKKPNDPPKPIHPLFLGKAAMKNLSPQKRGKTDSAAIDLTGSNEDDTRGRPNSRDSRRGSASSGRSHSRRGSISQGRPRSRGGSFSRERPRSAKKPPPVFSGFGGFAKILKFPGAIEPAWPWKGMIHIRGLDEASAPILPSNVDLAVAQSRTRKSKYHAVEILGSEDLLGLLAADLNISEVLKSIQDINLDDFPPLPTCLRLPIKHYETGPDIQRRIRKEILTRLGRPSTMDQSSSEDEIQTTCSTQASVHPGLIKMHASIATSLSAFDRGRCETQSWIHKHSPKCAAEILQTGREAFILKEWLQTLTVKSVEVGSGDGSKSRTSSATRRPASKSEKRKRKSKKLDGFVVSSDEEADDMDEISEPEDNSSPGGIQILLKKTLIRAGDTVKNSGRLTNAVVISGPHGSGKTAAVYAVAKELDFEVFEINPGSRRSGKDILEKVGDMTRNHLVQRFQGRLQVDGVDDDDDQRISDALANDLESGRQGTMNSFFKPKEPTKPKTKPKKSATEPKTSTATKNTAVKNAPEKQQKQSLILIEEADILYDDDKQFWTTIMGLIVQSKRPIIMTCNDESALPIQQLSLHAIIRFAPPPVDLAVDYMLLLAACEGHVLRRDAVMALYETRHQDLRASLTELNFWCQFAVGDQKSGLDWYYRRHPPGSDVDKHGHKIRVVSEETYTTGMGWLSHDFLGGEQLPLLDVEEEMLHETWDGWHLDTGDWQTNIGVEKWAKKMQAIASDKSDNYAILRMYNDFAEDMSAADLCSGGTLAPGNQVRPDKQNLDQNADANIPRTRLMLRSQNCPTRLAMTM
jgi:DNA polymerase III delta prime subunit